VWWWGRRRTGKAWSPWMRIQRKEEEAGGEKKIGRRIDALIPLCQDPDGSDRKRITKNKNLRVIGDKNDKLQEINLR
jgi:hypothetical protein